MKLKTARAYTMIYLILKNFNKKKIKPSLKLACVYAVSMFKVETTLRKEIFNLLLLRVGHLTPSTSKTFHGFNELV